MAVVDGIVGAKGIMLMYGKIIIQFIIGVLILTSSTYFRSWGENVGCVIFVIALGVMGMAVLKLIIFTVQLIGIYL